MLGLTELGVIGIIALIILILIIPIGLILLVGIGFANYFHFTGISWWAFILLFYFIIASILGAIGK